MFSSYGGVFSCAVDDLLAKGNPTLEEILDEENILIELRSGGEKFG